MALVMDHAADGVWLVTGTDNNWVLVADGNEVTLVDAGFPRDLPRVLSSLERIGRAPGDVRAIVLTHAHPDHIGASERLRAARGIPIRLLDAEAAHARGEVIQQCSELQILRAAWRPRVLLWAVRIARAGAARVERLQGAKVMAQLSPFLRLSLSRLRAIRANAPRGITNSEGFALEEQQSTPTDSPSGGPKRTPHYSKTCATG